MERPDFDGRPGNKSFQRALEQVLDYAESIGVNAENVTGWERDGHGLWRPPFSFVGAPGEKLGFTLYVTEDTVTDTNKVAVWPSVVTGLDTIYIPEIGTTALDVDPPPLVAAGDDTTISIKVEIQPATEQIPGTSPAVYRMKDSGFTVVNGALTIETSQADEQLPAINTATGAVTDNGIFHLLLGKTSGSGDDLAIHVQYMHGPLAVKFCGGMLSVMPPLFIHTGPLTEFTAV